MYFRWLHDEPSGCVSYLLADLEAGEAVLIDPRAADLPVLTAMLAEQRLRLAAWLRTHAHDERHPADAQALAASLGASGLASRPASGAFVPFGHEHLTVLDTPGHTQDDLSFLWRDRLFCGGLLAVGGCPDQPWPAAPEALWDSVMREVFRRPGETLVFSGHAGCGRIVSSVHDQRRGHPWFAGAGRDDFLARVRDWPGRDPAPVPTTAPSRAADRPQRAAGPAGRRLQGEHR
jgi:sulfur dioxygenase